MLQPQVRYARTTDGVNIAHASAGSGPPLATVILAARIAAQARGGAILVANAVRELCAGKGFTFEPRDDFVAKGFADAVRVFAAHWRD